MNRKKCAINTEECAQICVTWGVRNEISYAFTCLTVRGARSTGNARKCGLMLAGDSEWGRTFFPFCRQRLFFMVLNVAPLLSLLVFMNVYIPRFQRVARL